MKELDRNCISWYVTFAVHKICQSKQTLVEPLADHFVDKC